MKKRKKKILISKQNHIKNGNNTLSNKFEVI